MHSCTHTHIHTCTDAHTHMHRCTHTHTPMHRCTHAQMHTHTCTDAHILIHTCTDAYTHTYHTCMPTLPCTHTHGICDEAVMAAIQAYGFSTLSERSRSRSTSGHNEKGEAADQDEPRVTTPKPKLRSTLCRHLKPYLQTWICSQLKQSPCDSMRCGFVTCGKADACIGS